MKIEALRYSVKAHLVFSHEEVEHLMLCAKKHYDYACRATALTGEECGKNGLLVLAKISSGVVLWRSTEIDLMLKVLEPQMRSNYLPLQEGLTNELRATFHSLEEKFKELNKETL